MRPEGSRRPRAEEEHAFLRRQLAGASRVGPSPIVSFIIICEGFPARCFLNVIVYIKMKGKDNKKDSKVFFYLDSPLFYVVDFLEERQSLD